MTHRLILAFDGRATLDGQPVLSVSAVARQMAGGWQVEAAVPADLLGLGPLAPDQELGFTWALHDDDLGGGSPAQTRLIWRGQSTETYDAGWGTLHLDGRVYDFVQPPITPTPTPFPPATLTPTPTNTPTPTPTPFPMRYVAPGGDDAGSCTSPAAPCASINGALAKANPGNTIYVATGTYTSTAANRVVTLGKNVTLSGGWDAGFTAQDGASTIDGQAARGGIKVNEKVVATVRRFTILGGHMPYGAGINNWGALTLEDSTVRGNTADHDGGGIYGPGILTLSRCTVSENRAFGAIYSTGTVTVSNSTISANFTYGIVNESASVRGAVQQHRHPEPTNRGIRTLGGALTLQNSIIAGNAPPSNEGCYGIVSSRGHNLIDTDAVCELTPVPSDLVGVAPLLGPLADNGGPTGTHALLPGSPAIDAGDERRVRRPGHDRQPGSARRAPPAGWRWGRRGGLRHRRLRSARHEHADADGHGDSHRHRDSDGHADRHCDGDAFANARPRRHRRHGLA